MYFQNINVMSLFGDYFSCNDSMALFVGTPRDLPLSDFPTHADIARCFYQVSQEEKKLSIQLKQVQDQILL